MKQKIENLTGAELDYLVAKACDDGNGNSRENFIHMHGRGFLHYSEQWGLGGPIIERERIATCGDLDGGWVAYIGPWLSPNTLDNDPADGEGPTPLIAAMRAFVAARFGDEVEI